MILRLVRLLAFGLLASQRVVSRHIIIDYENGTSLEINDNQESLRDSYHVVTRPTTSFAFDVVLFGCPNDPYVVTAEEVYANITQGFFSRVRKCSRGVVTDLNLTVHGPISLFCNRTCDPVYTGGMETYAYNLANITGREAARRHVVTAFVSPRPCGYLGIAEVGGSKFIINGVAGLFNPGVMMHEWGHNLGLRHSYHNRNPYGDHTCLMGDAFGSSCFNAAHAHAVAWVQPVASFSKTFTHPALWIRVPVPPGDFVKSDDVYMSYNPANQRVYIYRTNAPDYAQTALVTAAKPSLKSPVTVRNVSLRWKARKDGVAVMRVCLGGTSVCNLTRPVIGLKKSNITSTPETPVG